VDPHGNEWVVRRKWVHRKLRWRGKHGADLLDCADLAALGGDLPVVGVILLAIALVLFAVGAVLLIVPALILVGELLIIVAIVGLGLMGRVLFGRPWTVEAQQLDVGPAYEWKVSGWRASQDLVSSIAECCAQLGCRREVHPRHHPTHRGDARPHTPVRPASAVGGPSLLPSNSDVDGYAQLISDLAEPDAYVAGIAEPELTAVGEPGGGGLSDQQACPSVARRDLGRFVKEWPRIEHLEDRR